MPAAPRAIYLIVLLEGYVVLAVELLAMRLLVPFVGSGTEIVAMVVGGVLLPLAAGYAAGSRPMRRTSIRKRLLRNAISAMGILAFGLSYPFLEVLFSIGTALEWHRLVQTAVYVALFLLYPIYLLAQTVPLVSHYVRGASLSTHTGRMLFFSTTGSFLGSILSTLVLMNVIGVHGTVIVTLGLLLLLVVILGHRRYCYDLIIALFIFGVVAVMNSPQASKAQGIVSNNGYNTIRVSDMPEEPGNRLLDVNHSLASKFALKPEQNFPYIQYIRRQFIEPLTASQPPKRILVLGAGGFTMGLGDTHNNYDYVDIDPAMKRVGERDLLKQKLPPNQYFHAISARAFLRAAPKKYDLILIDVYSHVHAIPAETTTVEFLQDVKNHVNAGGIVVANVIASPSFADRFTRRYSNGFAHVFPHHLRQVVGDFNGWEQNGTRNILYIYYDRPTDDAIYSDDRNTYFIDRK